MVIISILIFTIGIVVITNVYKVLLYANDFGIVFAFSLYSYYSSYKSYSISIEFLSDSLEIYTKIKEGTLKYILKYGDVKDVYLGENTIFIEKNNTEKFILVRNIAEQDFEKLKSLFVQLNEHGLHFDEQNVNSLLKNHLDQEKKKTKKMYLLIPVIIVLMSLLIMFIYKNY